MTTGGTESLIMACKAYRDYGCEENGITRPNIVMPRTAHSGFDKAAQYLGIHINYVDVDTKTYTVNIEQMKRKINKNTIMVMTLDTCTCLSSYQIQLITLIIIVSLDLL